MTGATWRAVRPLLEQHGYAALGELIEDPGAETVELTLSSLGWIRLRPADGWVDAIAGTSADGFARLIETTTFTLGDSSSTLAAVERALRALRVERRGP